MENKGLDKTAHAKNDLNLRIFHMVEDTVSFDVAHFVYFLAFLLIANGCISHLTVYRYSKSMRIT